ncbi:MAG: NAD(+)/NADH kinase [Fretibacterium sp.]|uniref:NAD(+)/NADH kinase n=1 Tax=Fretibacterium sp. OH1220_COT-178 TaxID=2491047 RepID=UPI000F600153|nr:NAD(+)/NADH kinase [Fretibacterium sp. OH1220_COT-178]MDO4787189.1 NAD(+)/NADH kinase [Fretibacterium sp.]RRD64730.1 NAD(+)/NADH kinase [Fretibacterium sp. OH1220_COT-178]
MKKLGMIVNTHKPEAIAMARRLLQWGQDKGLSILLPQQEASVLTTVGIPDEEWLRTVEVALVIGGDGTFLRAARYVLDADTLLYGINLGHLGFLASGKPDDAETDLENILNGHYNVLCRRLLRCVLHRDGVPLHTLYALNDVVLSKNAIARLLHIEVRFDDRFFGVLPADGVIVSSPTGSTAYALSAGGPIIPPHLDSMLLAPLCAHTLYSRPLMAAATDRISLIPRGSSRDITLTQDGQLGYEVFPGDRMDIELAQDKCIRTITMPERTFLDLVQEKLGWGQSRAVSEKE